MSAPDDKRKPHKFWPNYMMGGDCVTCGNTRAACEAMEREAMSTEQTGHSELVERLRVWACAADEGDRIAAQYALGKDADPALTSAMGDDLREAAAALTAQAEEIARLREALEEAQQFIESEFRDPSQEAHGDWLAREARPIHSLICAALGGKP